MKDLLLNPNNPVRTWHAVFYLSVTLIKEWGTEHLFDAKQFRRYEESTVHKEKPVSSQSLESSEKYKPARPTEEEIKTMREDHKRHGTWEDASPSGQPP